MYFSTTIFSSPAVVAFLSQWIIWAFLLSALIAVIEIIHDLIMTLITIMECGKVLQQMHYSDLLACSTLDQTRVEEISDNPKASKSPKIYKGTYHHCSYLMEHLSAACLREPNINDDDKNKIKEKYELHSERTWFHQQRK